jgi:acyl-CoA dehydrogenase
MTKEYELGQLSRRLWSWRDEFGSERYWSRELGRQLADAGADELWPRISTGLVGA